MIFVDNGGHTFSLTDYNNKPIGYEYDNQKYIFWINDNKLSINNYYCKIINFLVETDNPEKVECEVTLQSNIYKLISTKEIQEQISSKKDIKDLFNNHVNINEDKLYSSLSTPDFTSVLINQDGRSFILVPIYVVASSSETGVWTSNILIHINNNGIEKWCPITIGGTWVDESEILTINARNMGIKLPHDILRAVYQQSFINESFNEELYNEKLKEYLLNYMQIKGEVGNFRSAINSLKWFGYGDKVTISKLLQTDNEFQTQFVRDYFDIKNDIIDSFKHFRNSTLISLSIKENYETGTNNPINFSNDFWGEGNPTLSSYFNKYEKVPVSNSEETLYYWKPYYDYCFNELGLKLSALKYYYQKYFLPIHLSVHNASIEHKEYANNIKMLVKSYTSIVENPILLSDENDIEFLNKHKYFFSHQIHYVDENLNEFNSYIDNGKTFYINDTCLNIPIKFKKQNKLYNCVLLLIKVDDNKEELAWETHFTLYQNDDYSTYKDLVIYPKYMKNQQNVTDWNNKKFILKILCNGRWYEHQFNTGIETLNIDLGTLEYKYSDNFKQLRVLESDKVRFNSFMYNPDLVTINNIMYESDLYKYMHDNNITWIDRKELNENDFYCYIDLKNGNRVYFNEKFYGDNLHYSSDYKYCMNGNKFWVSNDDKNYEIINTYKILTYHSEPKENCIHNYYQDEDKNIYDVDNIVIKQYNTIDTIIDNYKENKYIVENSKYLNRLHIFDILEKYVKISEPHDYPLFKNNISLIYDGITVYHGEDSKIHLYGKYNKELGDVNENTLNYTNTFLHHIDILDVGESLLKSNDIIKCYTTYGYYTKHPNGTQEDATADPFSYDKNGKKIPNFYHEIPYGEENDSKYNIKVETPGVRYFNKKTNRYIQKDYPGIYWYDVDNNGNIVDNIYSDIYQMWGTDKLNLLGINENDKSGDDSAFIHISKDDKRWNDIDLMSQKDFNKDSNYFVSKRKLLGGEFKLSCAKNSDVAKEHIHLIYWLNQNDWNILDNDATITFTDDETKTGDNIILYTEGDELFVAIQMDKNVDYNGDTDTIEPKLEQTTKKVTFKQLEYKASSNKDDSITIDGINKYKYDLNVSQEICNLYNDLFYKKRENSEIKIDNIRSLNVFGETDPYDFYLMHDDKYWYGIYISKNTLSDFKNTNSMMYYASLDNSTYDFKVNGIKTGKEFFFKYIRSSNNFLINRMKYVSSKGINTFKQTDIIAATITNNYRLPFNLNLSSKWKVSPLSIGITKKAETTANTERAIINIPYDNNKYIKGYYNISVMYNLDTENNNIVTKVGRFKIVDDYEYNSIINKLLNQNTNTSNKDYNESHRPEDIPTNIYAIQDALEHEISIRIENDKLLEELLDKNIIGIDTRTYITDITEKSTVSMWIERNEYYDGKYPNNFKYVLRLKNDYKYYKLQ